MIVFGSGSLSKIACLLEIYLKYNVKYGCTLIFLNFYVLYTLGLENAITIICRVTFLKKCIAETKGNQNREYYIMNYHVLISDSR